MSEFSPPPEITDVGAYELTLDRYWAAEITFEATVAPGLVPRFAAPAPNYGTEHFLIHPITSNKQQGDRAVSGSHFSSAIHSLEVVGRGELGILLGQIVELLQATDDAHVSFNPTVHAALAWDRSEHKVKMRRGEQLQYFDVSKSLLATHARLGALLVCQPEDIAGS